MTVLNLLIPFILHYFTSACHLSEEFTDELALALIANEYGRGGKSFVAKDFSAGSDTIRLGDHELRTWIVCIDAFNMRGRKKAEEYLPNLMEDITDIIDSQSQTDPKFDSRRLYTKLTIKGISLM